MLALVGELGELRNDPAARVRQLFCGLCALTGARSGLLAVLDKPTDTAATFALAMPGGDVDTANFRKYQEYAAGQFIVDGLYMKAQPFVGRRKVIHRTMLVNNAEWVGSDWYNQIVRPMALDDCMYTFSPLRAARAASAGHRYSIGLGLSRPAGAPPFGARERLILQLLNRELMDVYEQFAASVVARPAALPPTLGQTLILLQQGLSESQIAARRGLSRHTIHDHVKRLHKHFGAQTRAELLARSLTAEA